MSLSAIFDKIIQNIQQYSVRFTKEGKRYLDTAVSKSEEVIRKGKIQFEIEKLKWELKQKYLKLGQYVSVQKITKSVTDFSHDQVYLEKINEVIKLQLYIDKRKKNKNSQQ